MTDRAGVPMLVGVLTYDHRATGLSKYNSALLFEPGKTEFQIYHKLHLVPFGEYVPLIQYLPWLTALTPYGSSHAPSLSFGREPKWIDVGPYRVATAICFEDTVPHVVRRFFHEAPGGRQPDVLLNLSNDGWFHGSSEHDMHLAASVFRAVENRVPLARAANTGVSAIVDGNGRVLKSLPKLKQDVLAGEVPLDDRVSLYTAWGDWLGLACLAVTIGLGPLALIRSMPRSLRARREARPLVRGLDPFLIRAPPDMLNPPDLLTCPHPVRRVDLGIFEPGGEWADHSPRGFFSELDGWAACRDRTRIVTLNRVDHSAAPTAGTQGHATSPGHARSKPFPPPDSSRPRRWGGWPAVNPLIGRMGP